MIAEGDIVLVDTNIIIEAHRTKCWRAIVNRFRVETVEKCCEEAATGNKRRAGYVAVDFEQLKKLMVIHPVSLRELAQIETRLAEPDRIDIGEKHLLAHAVGKPGAWYLSASDRAAVRAGNELGFLERFVSLETLAGTMRISAPFKNHFTEKWLSILRGQILMGNAQKQAFPADGDWSRPESACHKGEPFPNLNPWIIRSLTSISRCCCSGCLR